MSRPSILPVNAKVEIGLGQGAHQEYYFTRVISSDRNELRVAAPTSRGRVVALPLNNPVVLVYTIGQSMYRGNSVTIQRFQTPVPGLILSPPANVKKIERREFFRLRHQDKVLFRTPGAVHFREATFLDISGGGMLLYANTPLQVGDQIQVILNIAGFESKIIYGKIVRKRGYELGIAFQSLAPPLQDQIVRWIFDKQREFRRLQKESEYR